MELVAGRRENFSFFNIWVTTNCNYACKYCYEGMHKKELLLDVTTANQIVCFIIDTVKRKKINGLRINFHGGEPTLNFSMIEYVINELKKRISIKIYTSLTTNCSLFHEKAVNLLDEITVSIDGKKSIHDRERIHKNGKGTFDISFRNALLYLKAHSNVKVNMVVTSFNERELFNNIMFLINNGFKQIHPNIDYFDSNWNEELFDDLYLQLKRIKEEVREQGLKEVRIGLLDRAISTKKKCDIGGNHFQIYPDGGLYPCAIVAGEIEYCFGNVKTGIDEQRIAELNALMKQEVLECTDCKYYNCCTTCRCYFFNKKLTGSMYSPSAAICAVEHLCLKLKKI